MVTELIESRPGTSCPFYSKWDGDSGTEVILACWSDLCLQSPV